VERTTSTFCWARAGSDFPSPHGHGESDHLFSNGDAAFSLIAVNKGGAVPWSGARATLRLITARRLADAAFPVFSGESPLGMLRFP
jgi:hypothetical protein